LGATFLAAAAVSANAADVYEPAEGGYKDDTAYYPSITWTGFYAGIHAGGTFDDQADLVVDGDTVDSIEFDNAFIGGVHVGYNWQSPSNFVVGVEGSVSLLDDEFAGDDVTDYLATIRGRIGYAMDKALVYATGGAAFLGYSDEAVLGLGIDDDSTVGYVVGAGLDYKVTDNVSFGVEGLYYDFESDRFLADEVFERDFLSVQARLYYHFKRGYQEALK
jgi:outer membrane immunogenic protein